MVQSRTDYILGTDRRLFQNVAVRDPRHNTDQYMVLGCLPGAPLAKTKRYQGGTETIACGPALCGSTESRTEKAPREARRNDRILAETWRLVDERVATHLDPRSCQADRRTLGRKIRRSLAEDRKRWTAVAGAAVEELMKADPPLTQEAGHRLQGWYKATVDCPPPPARATLRQVTAEREKLYSRVPPPGRHHPGHN